MTGVAVVLAVRHGSAGSADTATGDVVRVVPSGRESTVERIVTQDGDLAEAMTGQSVTLTLSDEVDVSRGDVLSTAAAPPEVADQFEATIVWFDDEALLPGWAVTAMVAEHVEGEGAWILAEDPKGRTMLQPWPVGERAGSWPLARI